MRILQVNTSDKGGGAERVAFDLFRALRNRGYESHYAVGARFLDGQDIFEIPNDAYRNVWASVWRKTQSSLDRRRVHNLARLTGWLANLGELRRWREWRQGIEDFNFPGTVHLLNLPEGKPDVIHAHNLHGGYFDLRELAKLSQRVPVVLTLHDEWAFTGHCACTFDCDRWETGCGNCPDLKTYPAIKRDGTEYNWRRKRDIYSHSKLFVSAPSKWLLNKAMRSVLRPAIIEAKTIPYGIDLTIFKPGDKRAVRRQLRLPQEALVALFVANKTRSNPYKDYTMIEAAVQEVAAQPTRHEVVFLCLGEESAEQRIGSVTFRYVGYQSDPAKVAQFYQASDVYMHAARTDNFPNAVLEALACGIPGVATAVGGIPEQIDEGRTGFLVPQGDSKAFADRILHLLTDEQMRQRMSGWAAESARRRFDLERQVDDYLEWYGEALMRRDLVRGSDSSVVT